MLKAGDKAPDMVLLDQNGKTVELAKFAKKKVLVYFYPKADTPGCTAQSCGLRDVKDRIGRTVIIGISPDKPEKQKKFDEKYELGFTLLADTDKKKALCAACMRDMMLRHRTRFPFKAARRSGSTDERGITGDGCCSERILGHKHHNTMRTFWKGRGETNFDHIGS